MDVKKIGKIPDGGGWKAHGRSMGTTAAQKRARIGYDYVHAAVDDHSRLAYAEILPDEKGADLRRVPAPGRRVLRQPRHHRSSEVMTDNALQLQPPDFQAALDAIGATHIFIRPHCPWQNGKVERYNRTLQIEWAYRQVFTHQHRTHRTPWRPGSSYYNTRRRHSAIGGLPPISRLS